MRIVIGDSSSYKLTDIEPGLGCNGYHSEFDLVGSGSKTKTYRGLLDGTSCVGNIRFCLTCGCWTKKE